MLELKVQTFSSSSWKTTGKELAIWLIAKFKSKIEKCPYITIDTTTLTEKNVTYTYRGQQSRFSYDEYEYNTNNDGAGFQWLSSSEIMGSSGKIRAYKVDVEDGISSIKISYYETDNMFFIRGVTKGNGKPTETNTTKYAWTFEDDSKCPFILEIADNKYGISLPAYGKKEPDWGIFAYAAPANIVYTHKLQFSILSNEKLIGFRSSAYKFPTSTGSIVTIQDVGDILLFYTYNSNGDVRGYAYKL